MQLEDALIFSGIDAHTRGETILIPNPATDTPYEPPTIIYQRMKLTTPIIYETETPETESTEPETTEGLMSDVVLKEEWDFDGFVMSDFAWGITGTAAAANDAQVIQVTADHPGIIVFCIRVTVQRLHKFFKQSFVLIKQTVFLF